MKVIKRYEKYKDSGIPWIGEIPEHWEVKKIKYIGKTITGGTPSTNKDIYWNGKIPWIPSGKIHNNIITLEDVDKFITKEGLNESAAKLIKPQSVLVALTGATCANIGFLTFQSTANQSVVGIETNDNYNSKFLFYNLISQRKQILIYKSGSAQSGINEENIKNIFLSFPPKYEQSQIANYLDRKTAEIDELIAKKERLLDLYEEEKKAIINKAVTKGLNPNVKMKDSGIPWLGEIPKHWGIKRFKYFFKIVTEKCEKNLKKIGLENIESQTGKFIETDSNFEGEGIHFNNNDILFGKLRPYLAKVFLAPFEGKAIGDFFVFRCNQNVFPKFAFYRILDYSFISITNSSTFGAKMPRVSWDFIANLFIALPPLNEQQQIVTYIEKQISIIDSKIEKTKKVIELLKEYKTSLINEVVTGKRKVI